jgi:hypothetical protein
MTQEHTSRTLRELRDAGLIAMRRGIIEPSDWAGLKRLAQFDERYLTGRG